jgi:dienelactone hydrolase
MKKFLFIFGLLCSGLSQTNAQELNVASASYGVSSRSEIYSIPSLTISDSQFLQGDNQGKAVTVGGILRYPPNPTKISSKLPVVVLVHGSSGIGANLDYWSNTFLAQGYATFNLDSFTGRGLKVLGPNQAQLGRLNMILDTYRILDILKSNPQIDPKKIVLMGFSRGGQATLFASNQRFHQLWNQSGIEFAAYIPFYADCSTQYIGDDATTGKPIRLHHGIADDYNPIAPCRAYVERLKAKNQDVQLNEYPFGPHAFDSPIGKNPPVPSVNAQTVRSCKIKEESPGQLINLATGKLFQYTDACVERNPHVGSDVEATKIATQKIAQFLEGVFSKN